MFLQGISVIGAAVFAGTLSLILAIMAIRMWDRHRRTGSAAPRNSPLENTLRPIVFLFRGDRLVDATPPARSFLGRLPAGDSDWARLQQWIGPRFLAEADKLLHVGRLGRVELTVMQGSKTGSPRLLAEAVGNDLIRITLIDPQSDGSGLIVDSMSQQAMEEELDLLRRALDQTPMLVWRHDAEDRITWANAAYLRRAEAQENGPLTWPLPRLLESPKPVPGANTAARRGVLSENGSQSWYDCHSHAVGDQTMMFALPADAAVRAERSLREFVQTLTKTFADLPIGLAIFDRQRHLQLFNPALIDLTGLPTGFLTARPTLFDLLDMLRELRMVPEPKNYRSWRQQISDLESAAATGHHVETWSLPHGHTYRVTGRPHPDGAVAFLFEDITSEISMTRQFRAELSLGTVVLDGIEDALVVFASGDEMLMTNKAYRELWGDAPESLSGTLSSWEHQIQAGAGFANLKSRLISGNESLGRAEGVLTGPDGKLLQWTVTYLGVGRNMVRFRKSDLLASVPQDDSPKAEFDLSETAHAG